MDLTGLKNLEVLDKAETGIRNKWYKTPASLPTPIVLQLVRVWTKQNLGKKMTQHCKVWISLLTDIKLKEKKGIQSISFKIKEWNLNGTEVSNWSMLSIRQSYCFRNNRSNMCEKWCGTDHMICNSSINYPMSFDRIYERSWMSERQGRCKKQNVLDLD
jgi:hypothetical protein